MKILPLVALIAMGTPLVAQELNCSNPITQTEMTGCAALEYEASDAALNAVWALAMERARGLDAFLAEGEVPAATLLRDAQRAWIPFRDQACTAESLVARGGTLQNQLYLMCLTRLTRVRTEDLQRFGTLE